MLVRLFVDFFFISKNVNLKKISDTHFPFLSRHSTVLEESTVAVSKLRLQIDGVS